MKKLKQQNNKSLYYILLTAILFSTLVLSGVESSAVQASSPDSKTEVKTDKLPPNSKIFAPSLKDSSSSVETTDDKKSNLKESNSLFKKETKPTPKYSLKRFLLAMSGVLFSSLLIFGGLKLYKYLNSKNNSFTNSKKNKNSLESPKNLKETINLFLDKTDK